MNLLRKIITAFICVAMLVSCEKEEVELGCQEKIETYYSDYKKIWFKVDGSDSLYLNYGAQTTEDNSIPDTYIYRFEQWPNFRRLEMYFTRMVLTEEDSCAAKLQHRVGFRTIIDQGPDETKTYTIGSLNPLDDASSYAIYVGDKLNDDEYWRYSVGDSCGTIEITKYVERDTLAGRFNLNIDGIQTEGGFEINLNRLY